MKIKTKSQGYSMVALLVISVIGIIISTALVATVITNSQNASKIEQGFHTLGTAESAAENAILKLLRNPFYGGETMNMGDCTAVVTITGTTEKTITSTATCNDYIRTISVVASYNLGTLTINSWKEL